MPKLKTILTMTVEITEDLTMEALRTASADPEERYFADINRALMQVPAVHHTTLEKAQLFWSDSDAPHITLRACPFCGEFAPVHTEECTMDPCCDAECDLCEEKCYRVICDPDRGGCGVATIWADEKEAAAEDWNRRAGR